MSFEAEVVVEGMTKSSSGKSIDSVIDSGKDISQVKNNESTSLTRVDLNLFVVFDAIYREGNLTRAAERLHLSQPAVSHALNRLRERFNDPLFERVGKTMAPTSLSKAIIGRVRVALQSIESTITEGLAFDPSQSTRVFTMASRDIMEAAALPTIFQRINPLAPHVTLKSIRIPRRDIETALSSGQIDFAADVLLPVSDQIKHQLLGQEELVVVMRPDHPLADADWSLDAYLSSQHIMVSSRTEGLGIEDFALSRTGHSRSIRLRCQNYYAACQVVAISDLLLTLPSTYAQQLKEQTGNLIRPIPMNIPALEIHLYWHEKSDRDPAITWLRSQMLDLF